MPGDTAAVVPVVPAVAAVPAVATGAVVPAGADVPAGAAEAAGAGAFVAVRAAVGIEAVEAAGGAEPKGFAAAPVVAAAGVVPPLLSPPHAARIAAPAIPAIPNNTCRRDRCTVPAIVFPLSPHSFVSGKHMRNHGGGPNYHAVCRIALSPGEVVYLLDRGTVTCAMVCVKHDSGRARTHYIRRVEAWLTRRCASRWASSMS